MTAQQDGSELKRRMVSPEINIYGFCKTKKDAVSFVNESLSKFVPEGTSLSITITVPAKYEGCSVTPATTGSSVT